MPEETARENRGRRKNENQTNHEKKIEEGGTKSNTFWKMRRKAAGRKGSSNYLIITEEGQVLEDPEEAKRYIADYYKNLYQAREGKPEYAKLTQEITNTVEKIKNSEDMQKTVTPISLEELKQAIRKLKRGKASGPDGMPNEIFTEAQPQTLRIYQIKLNRIAMSKNIPRQWKQGQISRLYKGKGRRGKCSNERGITRSSNIGKVFERVLNARTTQEINITENQAGGQKGKATSDHILLLKEAVGEIRRRKKPVYMAFLDVTKAYDKAWRDAIMYVMHKEGLTSPEWEVIRKMNEDITATIMTKYGMTREIKIKDSIRHGGVLSVAQYALLMDEINKEITENKLGTFIPSLEENIGCLLWIDDAVLISPDPEELQTMLNITNEIAGRYHIEFGEEKSKIMKVGAPKNKPEFKLGSMKMEYSDYYKYLVLVLNTTNNLDDHIKSTKGKAEAAYQTILSIAGNSNMKNIEMRTIWELISCCIQPTITYSGEVWQPTKSEQTRIIRIMDNIIKRILMVPQSTPREALYIEPGLLDPETISAKNRIMIEHRLGNSNPRMKRLTETSQEKSWRETTDAIKKQGLHRRRRHKVCENGPPPPPRWVTFSKPERGC